MKKSKGTYEYIDGKWQQVAVGTGLTTVGSSAMAAIPVEVGAGFTAVTTDFADLLALAYPLMITITTGLVIFGMVKMFIHKAAGK